MLQLRAAFVSYNIARLRKLIQYLPKKKLELFQLIPFWIHVNLPKVPGYVTSQRTPRGIYRFHDSGFYRFAVSHYGRHIKAVSDLSPESHAILGVYLMGSSGTLAQTDTSDFDYWVVLTDDAMDGASRAMFQEKLLRIKTWSWQHYGQEVGLFALPLSDVRENRFVALDEDSAGSSQRTLLKEEFYRTFMMIAGKIPYWTVMPPGLKPGQFDQWVQRAQGGGSFKFIPEEYLDLGVVETIDPHECLGALLWQMFKACKSPFKSLLKAALITHYYFFVKEKGLLCDKIKSAYLASRLESPLTDPYAVVFQTAADFFQSMDNAQGLELLRECIYFRLCEFPRHGGGDRWEPSPRKQLLAQYPSEWGWRTEKIRRMAAFNRWPDGERLALEERIFQKLTFLYELIRRSGDALPPGLSMTRADLTALKNRIDATLKKKPGKLPRCSGYLRTHVDGAAMTLCGDRESGGEACWRVFHRAGNAADSLVFKGPGLLGAMGWLLVNGFYPPAKGPLRCRSAALSIGPGRVRQLVRKVHEFLYPRGTSVGGFASSAQWEKIVVLLHRAPCSAPGRIQAAELLAVNSWGEFFVETRMLSHLKEDTAICNELAECIFKYEIENAGGRPIYRVFLLMARPDDALIGGIASALASFRDRSSDERIGSEGPLPFNDKDDAPLLDLI